MKHSEECTILSCTTCDFKTQWKDTLKKHEQFKHKGWVEPIQACSECDYRGKKGPLRLHYQAYHQGKVYKCKECDYQANRKSNLGQHYKHKHLGIIHSCNQCEYTSKILSILKTHQKSHSEDYIIPESKSTQFCPDCDTIFKNKASLYTHNKRMHTKVNQLKNSHCVLCGKRDMTKDQLINHNRTHKEKEPSSCTTCNKRFSSKDSLSIHFRKYHTERNTAKIYSCDECERSDMTKIALYDHKRQVHKK